MTELMTLGEFAEARHAIWLDRAFGVSWGSDPSRQDELRMHHYTNLWREVDRHTVYLFNQVQWPVRDSDVRVVANTILFRTFNKIETHEALTEWIQRCRVVGLNPMDADTMFEFLSARKANFTGAYVRCPDLRLVCEFICNDLMAYATEIAAQLRNNHVKQAWKAAREMYSFGAFLTDQLIMDLDWLGGPLTYRSFMPKWGPGAKRGLETAVRMQGLAGLQDPHDLLLVLEDVLPPEVRPLVYGHPAMLDERVLEHTLCEYEKYHKFATRGDRRVKMRTYTARTADQVEHPLPVNWGAPEITWRKE